jgi:agmatine deiminase
MGFVLQAVCNGMPLIFFLFFPGKRLTFVCIQPFFIKQPEHMTRLLLIFLVLASWAPTASAQTDLPRNFSPDEYTQLQSGPIPPPPADMTPPPAAPVRTMAEWEELQALCISWQGQNAILAEIVRAAREECKVIICCKDQGTATTASTYLQSKGVDVSSNVDFFVVPNNSIWIRDYGPNCVYKDDVDSLYIVDWIYNRPTRPLDNALPEFVAQHLNLAYFSTSTAPYAMVHTGGNFMSDGMGTAFSSRLILEENLPGNPYGTSGQNESQINNIMEEYMGIHRYIKMDVLPYDEIHHIDMHMKLLDEETLLVGEYPEGVADGPQIEANIQYVLNNYTSVYGTPYKLVRIPMPPHNNLYPDNGGNYRTYANAVFVNKTVLVPFYQQTYDTIAQRIWETALPGYKIVGINCNAIIPSLGAIHCITKEIGVNKPLQIVHKALDCQDNTNATPYPVYASIKQISGIASAKVFYTTDLSQPWQSVDMTLQTDSSNLWKGLIPPQASGLDVYYYIQANANDGKTITRPLPAPEGYWKFCTFQQVSAQAPAAVQLQDIFPNPASAITCIPVESSRATTGAIRLLNALGQQVETIYSGKIPAGSSKYFLHADRYPPGTYIIDFQTDQQKISRKVIIK